MATPVPSQFPPTPPKAILTFDFNDFADGTGVVQLFGVIQQTSAGTIYTLTRSTAPSRGATADAKLTDNTSFPFNLTAFNTRRIASGTANFIAEFAKTGGDVIVTVTIQKVESGTGTVTTIGGPVVSQTPTIDTQIYNLPIPLTETTLNIGDNLRCLVALSDVGAPNSHVWCDPTGTEGEPLQLFMPFKIEEKL